MEVIAKFLSEQKLKPNILINGLGGGFGIAIRYPLDKTS